MAMVKNFVDLMELAQQKESPKIAVVAADDADTLTVVARAEAANLAEFILVGDAAKIKDIVADAKLSLRAEVRNEPDHRKAADLGVDLVCNREADVIMKGMLHSSVFLKALLNKEKGLNTGRHITQISVMEKDGEDGLMLITDCAISVDPDLPGKKEILENAIDLAHKLGMERPRAAVLASLEVVNSSMQDTVDAAVLSKMAERGQIKGCLVDGPFALDNAVSVDAAEAKGLKGEVAGKADILLVPNLTVGNTLTKAIAYIAKKTVLAATVGTAAPIVFTSRTESMEGKLLSIALAAYIS